MSGPAPTTVPAPAAPAPVTVTSVLEAIWADAGEQIVEAALTASGPVGAGIVTVLNEPIIGPILTGLLNDGVDFLISQGVIEIKVGIIGFLSEAAQEKWASEIVILKQVQAAGKILTAEQVAAYDSALQSLVENHPGIVNG